MKFRKAITLVAALCAVLMIGGTAMAANNVTTNVTSESVQLDSTCSKAGSFALRFDKNTVLTEGDRIEIKLPLGVTICTEGGFDMEISAGSSLGFVPADGAVAGVGGALTDSAISPVFFSEDAAGAAIDGAITGEVYFRISGSEGGQFVFLDVVGNTGGVDSVTVGADANDQFTILFFDQKVNATNFGEVVANGAAGIYVELDDDDVYDDDATLANNTLCINVSDPTFTATVVNASMDSAADKFTFVPSNPQIADIVNPQTIVQYVCKGDEPVLIALDERGEQATCDAAFDIDDDSGLCDGEDGFQVILRNATTPFALDNYVVTMEILVNGNTGANGVYWRNVDPTVESYIEAEDACGEVANDVTLTVDDTTGYEDAAGNALDAADLGGDDNCDVASEARAVKLTTDVSGLDLVANRRALLFNIPSMVYDLDDINDGDVVTVRITLVLPPCKIVATVDVEVGTFGCGSSSSDTLLFPYFTEMQGAGWWNGMAISNLTGSAGSFTATVYEADGDVATFTGNVAARSQWVGLLSGVSLTHVSGSGTLGDSTCYISVSTNFTADGFAMIGSAANSAVDGSETMGYLPRNSD